MPRPVSTKPAKRPRPAPGRPLQKVPPGADEGASRAGPAGNGAAAGLDERLYINSLEKGFAVLSVFDDSHRTSTIAQIAKITGLGRSATQRVVYTLHKLGYLRRDPVSREFALTAKVLALGYGYLCSDSLVEVAARFLAEIARVCEEAVSLSELDDTDIVVVSRVPSQHVFTLNIVQGMRFPAFCSAPGRAMLSMLPPDVAAGVIDRSRLKRITQHTIIDRRQIKAELDRVRIEGFSIAEEELYLGSLSVAVPVVRPDGMPMAAINVFCPIARWPRKRAEHVLVPLLTRCAREMSRFYGAPMGRAVERFEVR